jgi:hypothetical protein
VRSIRKDAFVLHIARTLETETQPLVLALQYLVIFWVSLVMMRRTATTSVSSSFVPHFL